METVILLGAAPSTPEKRALMERGTEYKETGIGKTVLVVDDNATIRKLLAAAFLFDGFKTCIEAENGKEAIDVAKRNKPDVIVSDLSMPVMNGLQSAPELRKLLPQTAIILFTLYMENLSQTEASRSGINLVLEKTVPLATLVEKAYRLVDELTSRVIFERTCGTRQSKPGLSNTGIRSLARSSMKQTLR